MLIKNGLIKKRSRLTDVVLINTPKAFVLYVPTCTAFNNIHKHIKLFINSPPTYFHQVKHTAFFHFLVTPGKD